MGPKIFANFVRSGREFVVAMNVIIELDCICEFCAEISHQLIKKFDSVVAAGDVVACPDKCWATGNVLEKKNNFISLLRAFTDFF